MADSKTLNILKSAILLEMRGKAFYSKVAQQCQNSTVRSFFESMAREEDTHVAQLSEQFKHYQETGSFMPPLEGVSAEVAQEVLNTELMSSIQGASYEAAAIGAAIGFEEKAVMTYQNRAKETGDENERAMYQFLADWEREHLNDLIKLDRHITESVWNDNSFWPM